VYIFWSSESTSINTSKDVSLNKARNKQSEYGRFYEIFNVI